MTFSRSAFSNRFFESGRPLYGPGRDRRDAASDDVFEDSELELDDGDDGEPGDSPESEDEKKLSHSTSLTHSRPTCWRSQLRMLSGPTWSPCGSCATSCEACAFDPDVRSLGQLTLDERKTTRPPWGRA